MSVSFLKRGIDVDVFEVVGVESGLGDIVF